MKMSARLGRLAVLAEMCDGEWALLGAQAASECYDPQKYDFIGYSPNNFTELLAAAWAALWYLTSELCGIPFVLHPDSMYTVWHNRLTSLAENSVCVAMLHTCVSVKSIPPTTENWLRKRYNYSLNNDTSTEDKHETNHINNKCNDMNMNTHKMHIT